MSRIRIIKEMEMELKASTLSDLVALTSRLMQVEIHSIDKIIVNLIKLV